jgi:hypothetical protein
MFANPFFCLKIISFKAEYRAYIDLKSGFSDPADFASTQSPMDCDLPKLFQGSGSEQKDLDPTGLGSVSLS